jgi:peroxiredoxin
MRCIPSFAGVATAALLVACGAGAHELPMWERPGLLGAVRPEMGPPQPGQLAPNFELPTLDGPAFRLQDARGSWVVLHFTASWCPFCDAEVEQLGKVAQTYADRNVKVVLVDVQEEQAHFTQYARAHVAGAVIALWDGSGDAARRYAPTHLQPAIEDRAQVVFDSTVIVDPKGRIRMFVLPDSKHFDPTFAAVRRELDAMLTAGETR